MHNGRFTNGSVLVGPKISHMRGFIVPYLFFQDKWVKVFNYSKGQNDSYLGNYNEMTVQIALTNSVMTILTTFSYPLRKTWGGVVV